MNSIEIVHARDLGKVVAASSEEWLPICRNIVSTVGALVRMERATYERLNAPSGRGTPIEIELDIELVDLSDESSLVAGGSSFTLRPDVGSSWEDTGISVSAMAAGDLVRSAVAVRRLTVPPSGTVNAWPFPDGLIFAVSVVLR